MERPNSTDSRRRVLVVDDDEASRELLVLLLEEWGHEVRGAIDGDVALREAREWRPDLVLLDLRLPGMDGFEVVRRLRADPATAGLRVVALTGFDDVETRAATERAGFDAHLVKGVSLEDISAALRLAVA